MQNYLFACFFFIAIHSISATDGRLLFVARLSGDQETPAVSSNGYGYVTFLMSADRSSMIVNGVVNGLSGPVTDCHLHKGYYGVSGPVIVNLISHVSGKRISGTLNSIPSDFVKDAVNGNIYINFHTAAHPGGEIRGQLTLETDYSGLVIMTGASEVPPASFPSVGIGTFSISPYVPVVRYRILASGLSGPITGASIHFGATGVNGPVVTNLGGTGNLLSGSFYYDPATGIVDSLLQGKVYANIYTDSFPDGELRGQIGFIPGGLVFDALLNGDQETPPVLTLGQGIGFGAFNATLDSFTYIVLTENVLPVAAHIHSGAPGVSGGVLATLTGTAFPGLYAGNVVSPVLNSDFITSALQGNLYFNVHSPFYTNGEVRGQIRGMVRDGYAFDLCGNQEVPPVTTDATGVGMVSIGREDDDLHYAAFAAVTNDDAIGAFISAGAQGVQGNAMYALNLPMYGYVDGFVDTISGTNAQIIRDGGAYLNIYTGSFANGEVRGQIVKEEICPLPVGIADVQLSEASLAPNPTRGESQLQLFSPQSFEGSLCLYDLTGKCLRESSVSVQTGDNLIRIDLHEFPEGMYMVGLRNEISTMYIEKIIKTR